MMGEGGGGPRKGISKARRGSGMREGG